MCFFLTRETAWGRQDSVRLQHSEGVDSPSCAQVTPWSLIILQLWYQAERRREEEEEEELHDPQEDQAQAPDCPSCWAQVLQGKKVCTNLPLGGISDENEKLQVDDNGKINRLRRECPAEECGAGVFMAAHHDRQVTNPPPERTLARMVCGTYVLSKQWFDKFAQFGLKKVRNSALTALSNSIFFILSLSHLFFSRLVCELWIVWIFRNCFCTMSETYLKFMLQSNKRDKVYISHVSPSTAASADSPTCSRSLRARLSE